MSQHQSKHSTFFIFQVNIFKFGFKIKKCACVLFPLDLMAFTSVTRKKSNSKGCHCHLFMSNFFLWPRETKAQVLSSFFISLVYTTHCVPNCSKLLWDIAQVLWTRIGCQMWVSNVVVRILWFKTGAVVDVTHNSLSLIMIRKFKMQVPPSNCYFASLYTADKRKKITSKMYRLA